MPYSKFTFDQVRENLELEISDKFGVFTDVGEIEISDSFCEELLNEKVPLALAINTEKARSELIITPVLYELRKYEKKNISLFSGIDFNIDESKGLNGICDYIISLSREQFFLDVPIVTIVEAKNEKINSGLPQCMAEMKAAQIFNQNKGNKNIKEMFGVVTTGSNWKFLVLENNKVTIELKEYFIQDVKKILWIFHRMFENSKCPMSFRS